MLIHRFSMVTLLLVGSCAMAQSCDSPDARVVRATVSLDEVQRSSMPPELFGFNVPWRDFSIGFLKSGAVLPELVELLKPFKGAVYRYPGGGFGNSFEWGEGTTGPVDKRKPILADYGRYAKPEFGPLEFMRFVESVGGRALLTVNLIGPPNTVLPPSQLAPLASEFARFVMTTPGLGCAGGKDCRVMALELGNELDWPPNSFSADAYAERAEAVRATVTSMLPGAVWIAHGRSAPWDPRQRGTSQFNGRLAQVLAKNVQGIAFHAYYDGIDVAQAANYVRDYGQTWAKVRPDAGVYVTEHARWPSQSPPGGGRTTGTRPPALAARSRRPTSCWR